MQLALKPVATCTEIVHGSTSLDPLHITVSSLLAFTQLDSLYYRLVAVGADGKVSTSRAELIQPGCTDHLREGAHEQAIRKSSAWWGRL